MTRISIRYTAAVLFITVFTAIYTGDSFAQKVKAGLPVKLTSYVDPYIGTGFHGHVFMGANVPFGAVQLGPTNMSEGWDWCSGYHYSDSTIIGFAHTHLSGTGIGDLGDILFMPVTGDVKPEKGKAGDPASGYYSSFSHQEETAKAGYYSVKLKRYGIKAELTATGRVGFHRYTFPPSEGAKIVIDLKEGIGWDRSTETYLEKINDSTVAGYRFSSGWAPEQRIYFSAVFSRPIKNIAVYDSTAVKPGNSLKGMKVKAMLSFGAVEAGLLELRVGISPVSIENAMDNIRSEAPGWNFEAIAGEADRKWENELKKVSIRTEDKARLRTFYTALYHTMIAPSLFNDHNGDYRGTDMQVHKNASFSNLTTFSLWDTYRAAHSLFTLLQPEKVNDMVNTMLAIYQQQGKLPVWHLMGNETNTMVGNPAIPVVADAYLKGFKGFDAGLAYEAVKKTAMLDERGLDYYKKLGYIPADSVVESVAMGLEYAIADWSISQMAKKMNKPEDYSYFLKRGKNYRNYFDNSTGFMRGRLSGTAWREPFSPIAAKHRQDDYTEGNGWQYTWLVPQDVEGLIALQGGERAFVKKLDSLFIIQGNLGEEASPDISGLIGQYAHGNEPSHHITYLYAFAGQPWKTADKVRYILDKLYTDKYDGLCGNEDVGQMSAWYVLSSLGFYPVNPSNGLYVFGSPSVDHASLDLGSGRSMNITVRNNSPANKYIQKITLNGHPYTKSYILYKDLVAGGNMIIEMAAKPSPVWGIDKTDRPYSEIR